MRKSRLLYFGLGFVSVILHLAACGGASSNTMGEPAGTPSLGSSNYSLYVSALDNNASDANEGTITSPLLTIKGAIEKASQLNQYSAYGEPFTIYMTEGDYEVDDTIVFSEVAGIIGGYDAAFSNIMGFSDISFAPAQSGDSYTIFRLEAIKVIFKNIRIFHSIEGTPVFAMFTNRGWIETVELENSYVMGNVTFDAAIDDLIVDKSTITGTDGKMENVIYSDLVGFHNAGLVITFVSGTLIVKDSIIYCGSPSAQDNGVWKYGLAINANVISDGLGNDITIENNNISCGMSSVHSCNALYVSATDTDLRIINNDIGNAMIYADDTREYYSQNIGISIDYIQTGTVELRDNRININDAERINAIEAHQWSDFGTISDEEWERLEITPLEGLSYLFSGNDIRIYGSFEDPNNRITGMFQGGRAGRTTIIDNYFNMPIGSEAIVFKDGVITRQENNTVELY